MSVGSNNIQNAIYIYVQTLLSLLASLLVSRTVLNLLGVQDYGIYSVVGGVVALFVFINTAMAISTQRHLTFEMGRGNDEEVGRIYSASIVIHLFIGIIIFLFAELIAIKLFSSYINIPADRMIAATRVYHLAVFSIMFSIMNVPQQALLNSKENFRTSSMISFLYSVLYLVSAYLLNFFHARRLEIYALLIFVSSIIVYLTYKFVCHHYYRYRFYLVKDISLYRELTGFAGWNLLGSGAMVLRNQGIAIVLNLFYGVTINASYGIANQVGSAAEQFAQSVIKAFNPSIVKKYGANQMTEMFELAFMSSRISFYILYLMALPLIIEINFVLKLWLKNVPEYAPIFCVLLLFNVMVEVLSFPLMTIAQATGNIRLYQLTNSLLLALNIPCMFFVIKKLNSPQIGLIGVIFLSLILLLSRLFFLRRIANMRTYSWVRSVIFKIALPVVISMTVVYGVSRSMEPGVIRFILTLVIGTATTAVVAWTCGFGSEKEMISRKMKTLFAVK
jgi:O-antigen/teichoic acid export membrane protein